MKSSLMFVLIFVYFGLLMSCAKNTYTEGGSCDYEKFSGVLTIHNIEHKKDEYGKWKIIHGTFIADNANAPKSLKPAEFSLRADDGELPQITVGKKFKLEVSEIISGTCTPRIFELPEKWREIQK